MDNEYKIWIAEVKQKMRSAQVKAAIAVNSALIEFLGLSHIFDQKQNVLCL
jgi:hypothetical protein